MKMTVNEVCSNFGGTLVTRLEDLEKAEGDYVISLGSPANDKNSSHWYVFKTKMDWNYIAFKSADFDEARKNEGYSSQFGMFTK